jgi:hypothetical protein
MALRAPVFYGNVIEGKIKLDNPTRFKAYKDGLEGKRVQLVLKEKQDIRSEELNRYYWGVVVAMLAEEIGESPEDMHEALKAHFKIKSTAALKTKEFLEFLEQVKRWAATFHGVNIPDPGEVDF